MAEMYVSDEESTILSVSETDFEHIYAHIHTLTFEYYFRRMTEIYERVPIGIG